jgi:pentatricopeptide repeat protein
MVEKGEKTNVTTYGSLLYGYVVQGNFIEMTHLIDLMVQNEIARDHHVFNILIHAYGKHGLVDKTMLTFNDMRRQGLIPDKVSYGSVIDALCKAGPLDDVMFQFNQMINEGQSPNIYIFSTLIHCFSTCDNWEKAEVLFSEMLYRAFVPMPLSSVQ